MRFGKALVLLALCAVLAACVPVAVTPAPPPSSPAGQVSPVASPSPSDLPAPPSPSEPAGPVAVQSAYADEVDLSAFSQVHRLTDAVGDAFPGEFDVAVWCEEEMLDFIVSTVEYDGESFTVTEDLCSFPRVAVGEAVTFAAWIPESIPGTMVSFLTADGRRIERLLAWSGLDGSVHLIEV